MIITNSMNLNELNARTQDGLTDEETAKLRDLLNETEYESTEEVPENEWLNMLEEATK